MILGFDDHRYKCNTGVSIPCYGASLKSRHGYCNTKLYDKGKGMPKVVSYLILLVWYIMSLILLYCLTTPSRPDCRVIFFQLVVFYGFKFCNSLPQAWNENLEWSQIAWNIFLNNKLLFPGLLSLTFLTRFFCCQTSYRHLYWGRRQLFRLIMSYRCQFAISSISTF